MIDGLYPAGITIRQKLADLGRVLKGTNYCKKQMKNYGGVSSNNSNNINEEEEEADDTVMEILDDDYGDSSSSDEESSSSDEERSSSDEESSEEHEQSSSSDEESSEEDDEECDGTKHNGDPIGIEHIEKLNSTRLKFAGSFFKIPKFSNNKVYTDDQRREYLINLVNKQDQPLQIEGDREYAKKRIYHFLTKQSPNPIDAKVWIKYAEGAAYLCCGPHLGKCAHALMIRGHSSNFPVLMMLNDEDFDGFAGELKDAAQRFPKEEEQRIEKSLWEAHKKSEAGQQPSGNRTGRKRKRTEKGATFETANDEKFKKQRLLILSTKLKKKIKLIENQRKKRHLTLKHLTFSRIGRDVIDHAFRIKAAMTTSITDPCPELVAADALNESYLKMDVMRVTRFAACWLFFLGLAKGEWDGKPIPYAELGLKIPTPLERLSFLGMAKFAKLINTIFVECVMSYRVATFEKLVAAEAAAGELLIWHLQFDSNFERDACFGACFTRYQLEGLFGMLRTFRRLLTRAQSARQAWEAHNRCTAPFYLFSIKFGRLGNSYIEGRFSIFRCSVGNASMDGVSLTSQFKSMMAREMRGMVRIGIERKQYKGLREQTEELNNKEDMKMA